ncbi:MAG: L,D-transpeptidase [Nanoarchaeota archaeon]
MTQTRRNFLKSCFVFVGAQYSIVPYSYCKEGEAMLPDNGVLPQDKVSARMVVSLDDQILRLYQGNQKVEFPCVVGRRNSSGVSITPLGLYVVVDKSSSDTPLEGRFGQAYGKRFIKIRHLRLGSYLGVHGTNEETKLDEKVRFFSRGCIRLYNKDIESVVYPTVCIGDIVQVVAGK